MGLCSCFFGKALRIVQKPHSLPSLEEHGSQVERVIPDWSSKATSKQLALCWKILALLKDWVQTKKASSTWTA